MKALKKWMPLAFAGLLAASSAQAVVIDFNGSAAARDPDFGEVSFWAGDPSLDEDTIVVEDVFDPSNQVLTNGIWPSLSESTFIGVTKSGTAFGSVSFKIRRVYNLVTPTDFSVKAFLSGAEVITASATASSDGFIDLALSQVGAFDTLHIYDDLNTNAIGEYFDIDDFVYTEYQPPCTGPNCNPTSVPEPSALLLLGIGMAGFAFARKYKSA
jgi:hypothetical protein